MRHVIHGSSKVRYHCSSIPYSSSPTRLISDFLTSTRGPNLGISFDEPLPSHRGPKLESAYEVLDFEFVGIPLCQFPSVFKTDDCFFLPVFQKFHFRRDVNGLPNPSTI
ncbi:hypothetical protein AVEN_91276-1 [Araneus ventricosus]|uniref:Uncharacterized protein n=1 Tax=Araneus ventricosus TaxID=182803 RepID=A0A4Y2ETN3_ARAVE|nr:hypothetical protein AVEN_91276-1 [Araneus ventricosus]